MSHIVHYSIVQVVPDPARGERLNVGVIAWDGERRRGAQRFSRSKQRLRALGLADDSFLTDFRLTVAGALKSPDEPLFPTAGGSRRGWSLEVMQRAAIDWGGMIQLSEPRAAISDDPTRLCEEIYGRTVHLRKDVVDVNAGKEAVRRSVAYAMRAAIEEIPASGSLQVHVLSDIQGGSGVHAFDVTLDNGSAVAAVVTPNFLNPKTAEVRRDLEAAAWSIQDVREADPKVAFSLVRGTVHSPKIRQDLDGLQRRLEFEALDGVAAAGSWAREQANRLAATSK